MRWNHDLLGNPASRSTQSATALAKTIAAGTSGSPCARRRARFPREIRALDRFAGGSLQMRGGYVMRLPDGSSLDLRNLTMRGVAKPRASSTCMVPTEQLVLNRSRHVRMVDERQTLAVKASDCA